MSAKAILKARPNSFKFSERVLDLEVGQHLMIVIDNSLEGRIPVKTTIFQVPVKIGRAFKTEKSSSRNAYFDCKVCRMVMMNNSRIVNLLNCYIRSYPKLTRCSFTRLTRVVSFFSTRAAATEPSSTTSGSASRGPRVSWRRSSPGTSWGLAQMFWTSLAMWLRRASSWRSDWCCLMAEITAVGPPAPDCTDLQTATRISR